MSPVYSFGARTVAVHLGGVLFRVTANVFSKLQACSHDRVRQPLCGWEGVCGAAFTSGLARPQIDEGLIWVVKAILTNGSLANHPCLLSFVLSLTLSRLSSPTPSTPSSFTGRSCETLCLHHTLNTCNEGHKNTMEQMDEQESRRGRKLGLSGVPP